MEPSSPPPGSGRGDDSGGDPLPAPDAAVLLPRVIGLINGAVTGTLTVHYAARNVSFELPGDVAIRVMVAVRRGRPDGLDDPIDLATTCALDGYIGISTRDVLAVTWTPAPEAEEMVSPTVMGIYDRLAGLSDATGPGDPHVQAGDAAVDQ